MVGSCPDTGINQISRRPSSGRALIGKMKNKSMVFSASVLFLLSCCSEQKAGWQAKTEYENGMKVIMNPSQPFYGEILLDLEENLSIGREDDSNYMFYRARSLALDDNENIYVLDSGNQRVQKFDSKGQYLQTTGKKGQGPGDFENPEKLFLDGVGNLYILDGQKIKVFDSRGNSVKNITLQSAISDFCVSKKGDIFGLLNISAEESKRAVIRLDPEGNIIRTIAEFPDVKSVGRKQEGGGFRFKVYHIYSPRLCLSPIDGQQFYYAHALDYELFVVDEEGNVVLKIKNEEKSQTISQKEKEEIIKGVEAHISRRGPKWPADVLEEACNFSSRRPFFYGVGVDDKKRLCVWRVKSVLDKSEEEEFDLFSREGYYLYRLRTPVLPYAFRKGFLYDIKEDGESGGVRVRRFRIKNWHDIKDHV